MLGLLNGGVGIALYLNQKEKVEQSITFAQENQAGQMAASREEGENDDDDKDKTFFQKNVIDFEKVKKEKFKIPHLLQEREQQKQQEYAERKDVDVSELGVSDAELATMKELDYMYGGSTTKQELEEIENEDAEKVIDPYLKKKKRFVKAQQFRQVIVGPEDLLKNGQML